MTNESIHFAAFGVKIVPRIKIKSRYILPLFCGIVSHIHDYITDLFYEGKNLKIILTTGSIVKDFEISLLNSVLTSVHAHLTLAAVRIVVGRADRRKSCVAYRTGALR